MDRKVAEDYLQMPAAARELTRRLDGLITNKKLLIELLRLLDQALHEALKDGSMGELSLPSIQDAWKNGLISTDVAHENTEPPWRRALRR